jgi:hypothetical protein
MLEVVVTFFIIIIDICRDLSIKALLAPPLSQMPCQFNKARANCQLSTLLLRTHFGAAYVAARS